MSQFANRSSIIICAMRMRSLFLIVASVFLLVSFAIQGQEPNDKGGGAKAGGKGTGGGNNAKGSSKNLQVLDANNVPAAMQSFVMALGLLDKGTCSYCHVDDRTLDDKPQKVTARKMISMVRELNARFQDGKAHVTCWTCHRGSTAPPVAP